MGKVRGEQEHSDALVLSVIHNHILPHIDPSPQVLGSF